MPASVRVVVVGNRVDKLHDARVLVVMPNAFWEDVSNALAVARNGSRQLVDLMCSSAIVAWMEGEGMDPDTVPVEDGEGLTVIFWGIAA